MSLEDRIDYFNSYIFEIEGLPDGISYNAFFDSEMLNYIYQGDTYLRIRSVDWKNLFSIYYNDQEKMNLLMELLLSRNREFPFEEEDYNYLMNNNIIANSFVNTFISYANQNKSIKKFVFSFLLNNDIFLNSLLSNESINFDNLISGFVYLSLDKERFLKIIRNKKVLKSLLKMNISDFLSLVDKYDLSSLLGNLLNNKINHLSYKEKLEVAKYKYNPETGKPEYLRNLYQEFEKKINNDKKRYILLTLREDSKEEKKEEARKIISTTEGKEIFLSEVLEPSFSNVVRILGLDNSIYQMRSEALLNRLNSYQQYDLGTIKEILCLYCFNDVSKNIKLRLKTILEYVQNKYEIADLLKNDLTYLESLYKFLESDKLEVNPLDLINNIDINSIINSLHEVFNEDVRKETNIRDILSNSDSKIVNGVKVIDTDIPLNRSKFVIHSMSVDSPDEISLERYQERAKKYKKICMSILDNNHTHTFLNGIVFGYCNIEAPIYSAIPFDGQTNQRPSTNRPQYRSILSNVDTFLRRTTRSYNEITYFTNKEVIMPSYIFVANRDPNEMEYLAAKEFNIPILIYHTKDIEYNFEEGYTNGEPFDYETNKLDYIPVNKEMVSDDNKGKGK